MIQLIEAPPRSGKSYFAVNYLVKFTTYDAVYHEYVLDANVLIISNIEGLKIKHWHLDEVLEGKTLQEFFSIANFEQIMKKTGKNHIIICIDECHDYFPAGFNDKDIYSFFAFHGHLGLDIILMTQGIQSMSRMFNPLLEYIVKVTPRSRQLFKSFSYSYTDLKGRFLYSKSLPKKPLVFQAYKSFRKDEVQKPKNAVMHWAIICVVFFLLAGFLFKTALALVNDKAKPKNRLVTPPAAAAPFKNASTVKPAYVPLTSPVAVPFRSFSSVSPVAIWRSYPVEAYIREGRNEYFMIMGNFVDSRRCRNYSARCKTVDYFGVEQLQERRAISGGPGAVPLHSVPGGVPARNEPLGEGIPLGYTPPNRNIDYVPIPPATDYKTSSVINGQQVHVPVKILK